MHNVTSLTSGFALLFLLPKSHSMLTFTSPRPGIAMSQESNAGLRRADGGFANVLGNLTVAHQPRHSEHLVSR